MGYFVYVIKCSKRNWYYVGISSNLEKRLKQHNTGQQRSTKPYAPYKLVYRKYFSTRREARNFEKFLKIRSNKEKLLESVNKPKGRVVELADTQP